MPAPQRIKELVESFKVNFDHVQSKDFLEEDLRTNFLNPFFQELGWDMEDRAGKGAMRDVHYEKTIKAGAPDYGFYTDGKLRFFVEAKRPAVDVCNNQAAALQLRGYGWSAKVPLSILTDFEEFSIYDTTVKPKHSDHARIARVEGVCIKYSELVERWDEIAVLFSREAVMAGSLEKLEKKKSKQAVDQELLVDISRWRDLLAHNIANRNEVSEERLNRIVQDTIARILFLRICEDRGIANEGDLSDVADGAETYAKLYKLFKKAEQRYDSDLFEVESIANLVIDDKVLKEVISELYFPKSPYKFDAIPAEILGQVYEQFLGKVIRLTEGGHAKVEEKMEVRKAGGIYYTPTYIVEYIVRNTVGKLIEGKTPKKIETLTIVDPACGSGSFLLGAYKFLADWYRDWYVADGADKQKKAKKIYQDKDNQWQLTLDERKRILTTHIYGVDLDRQAVEMAKLSLMLEALRSPEQQSLFNDRMLPRLGDNIKCGNSLIASDFSLVPEDLVRVHAFDWQVQFPMIMKTGGFDAVIGNPPYNLLQPQNVSKDELDYFHKKFSVAQYKVDLYHLFIEQAIRLVRDNGYLSFITPAPFTTNNYTTNLRKLILDNVQIRQLVTVPDGVFEQASVDNAIFLFQKSNDAKIRDENEVDFIDARANKDRLVINERLSVSQSLFIETSGMIFRPPQFAGFAKIENTFLRNSKLLGDLARVNFGMQLRDRTKFPGDVVKTDKPKSLKGSYKPCLTGKNIDRYFTRFDDLYCLFDRVAQRGGCWDEEIQFASNKVIVRQIGIKPIAAFDPVGFCCLNTVFMIKVLVEEIDERFILGVLNSSAIGFYWQNKFSDFKKTFPKIKGTYLQQLPIPIADKAQHDELVGLVNKILDLTVKAHVVIEESEKAALQNAVMSTDLQIDQLVYELYGLTDDEIGIVEKGVNNS